MVTDVAHSKRALRAELRERRRILTSSEREFASVGITSNLETLTTDLGARTVACYLSGQNEPDTRPFLRWARSQSISVLFPLSREDGLLDWTRGEDGEEIDTTLGIPEAVGEPLGPIAINDVDLIIIPAAAVDHSGLRLGWGRGYFDKTLGSMQKCPPVYAVVFDGEYVDEVPREVHDQPVNGVVTPSRIITF